jgi:hypothetical protein
VSARFCAACGAALALASVAGETRARLGCSACARVHYENPRVRVGGIAAAADGAPVLRLARLGHGEKLQTAVLRAFGGAAAALEAQQLALYCALADLDVGEVLLLFRLLPRSTIAVATGAAGSSTGWSAGLLDRYAADARSGTFRVYAGTYQSGVLQIEAVPQEECRA